MSTTTRQNVVRALKRLGRKLQKGGHRRHATATTTNIMKVHSLDVRQRARVPIINLTTAAGFEVDIALGGHAGVDTSGYAAAWIRYHPAFAPVVVLLKALLLQTELDKPFTGGLGSYKLYVMVAYHLERHRGSDRPGDVFLSFLRRFGGDASNGDNNNGDSDRRPTTALSQQAVLTTSAATNGVADFTGVFKLENCVTCFGMCYRRLVDRYERMNNHKNGRRRHYKDEKSGDDVSFLCAIFDYKYICREREMALLKAKVKKTTRHLNNNKDNDSIATTSTFPNNNHEGAVNAPHTATTSKKNIYAFAPRNETHSSSIHHKTTYKQNQSSSSSTTTTNANNTKRAKTTLPERILHPKRLKNTNSTSQEDNDDDDQEQGQEDYQEATNLMAGYGMQRGPRGGLIPLYRPDVEEAKKNQSSPTSEILTRGRKQRKNKKKQQRDVALTEFANRMTLS